MKKTMTSIGIIFLIIILYISTLNIIVSNYIMTKQSSKNFSDTSGDVMANINVNDIVVVQVNRPFWYGDVTINYYEQGSVGRKDFLGYSLIVVINGFNMMNIYIMIIILSIIITFIIFIFELNLYGGNINEKMG